jgi:exonuclease SbcC
MGFAQALVGSDLLILDEPTAYLDDTRRAELVQTLTYASPAKQMLIVTHDDDFKSVAQKIIRVQKDDSTLVSNVSIEE